MEKHLEGLSTVVLTVWDAIEFLISYKQLFAVEEGSKCNAGGLSTP
jgi:hypothetical protein